MNSISVFLKLLVSTMAGLLLPFHFNIDRVDVDNRSAQIISQLQQFEKAFVYPFSDDEEFTIQHGLAGDYYSFFKRLGKPYYYVVKSKHNRSIEKIVNGKKVIFQQKAGEIAAAGCAILTTVKTVAGKSIPAWYICDVKVNPNYQGEHIPVKVVQQVSLSRFVQCPRGFAICMNPPSGEPKIVSIFKKHGPLVGIHTQTLNLYTLTGQQAEEHHDALRALFVKHGYMKQSEPLGLVSTSGSKDYVIRNKKTDVTHAWQLLHFKPGVQDFVPQPEATHMLCAVEGTSLNEDFKQLLGSSSSTAQIVSYGMNNVDFNFLTSDHI